MFILITKVTEKIIKEKENYYSNKSVYTLPEPKKSGERCPC